MSTLLTASNRESLIKLDESEAIDSWKSSVQKLADEMKTVLATRVKETQAQESSVENELVRVLFTIYSDYRRLMSKNQMELRKSKKSSSIKFRERTAHASL